MSSWEESQGALLLVRSIMGGVCGVVSVICVSAVAVKDDSASVTLRSPSRVRAVNGGCLRARLPGFSPGQRSLAREALAYTMGED